ncbi:beta-lactamase/transpeptidase-like protein [Pleomassaria siparia CBS 279.74]|uniref:Beta-lactamase/transpeptidase-like protein n=1 Tax=Pleomassaria siparia CBS 279.74 TaxID=1314801 RepID=A0A6G1K5B4_9PLEO|nr:beta-lactamase/transpeptidase-like protein [Pleomassaria siparia CBS 279.74]
MSSSFDETFKRAVSPGPERLLAGVALAAAGPKKGDSDYLNAFGTMDLDPASSPVSPTETVMWLASCSKIVTTIAVMQCVERGLFELHSIADFERLLPEWSNRQILTALVDGKEQLQPAKEKMTLARLINHTSGMGYDFISPLLEWRASRGEAPQIMQGPITEVLQHPICFEPGSGFAYSSGLDLAGLMVARANSCTLEEYMRKHIFGVLGMDDTSFRPLTIKNLTARLMPMVHRPTADEPLESGDHPRNPLKAPLEPYDDFGGSGLFSTAADFLKFLKSVQRNDGQLLKPETVDLMFEPAISGSSMAMLQSTLGIDAAATIMIPGERLVGTPGAGKWSHGLGGLLGMQDNEYGLKAPWMQWGGAPNLKWWIDRKGGTCGLFATQLAPAGEKKHQVLPILFQKQMASNLGKK